MKTNYSYIAPNPATSVKSASRDTRISFKNTRETSRVLRGKKIDEAIKYLQNVIDHKQCIPMRRYARGCGRTRQARQYQKTEIGNNQSGSLKINSTEGEVTRKGKEFKETRGRWPQKSCEFFIFLLKNMKANAAHKNIDYTELVLTHVQVNKAPKIYGRLYRAHGRVNSYNSSPCHIELVAEKMQREIEDTDQRIEELN